MPRCNIIEYLRCFFLPSQGFAFCGPQQRPEHLLCRTNIEYSIPSLLPMSYSDHDWEPQKHIRQTEILHQHNLTYGYKGADVAFS